MGVPVRMLQRAPNFKRKILKNFFMELIYKIYGFLMNKFSKKYFENIYKNKDDYNEY